MEEDQEYRREYETLEQEDEALATSNEEYFIEQTLVFIKANKNVSSKDLATALRCCRVPIKKEILQYIADRLDGTQKKRGRPINIMLESAREAFSDRNFLAEDIQARYNALKKEGLKQDDIYNKIGKEHNMSPAWVQRKLYPRNKS